jgi:hypothetical protein
MEDETGKENTTHRGEVGLKCRHSFRKYDGTRPSEKRRRNWDNIITEMGRVGMDWIHLAEDTVKFIIQ